MLKANILNGEQRTDQEWSWVRDIGLLGKYLLGLALILGLLLMVATTFTSWNSKAKEEASLFQVIHITDVEAQLMTAEFNIEGGPHVTSFDLVYIFSRIGYLATYNPQILDNWESFQIAVIANATRETNMYTALALNDTLLNKAYQFIIQRIEQNQVDSVLTDGS